MTPRYQKTESIKEFERLALEEKRKKFPNVPYLAPIIFEDKTANGLTKAIISFVKLKGGQAERISSSGRVIQKNGVSRYIPGTSTNGTADISAIIKGKSIKIEVKISRDVQSEAQKKYQEDIERAGGTYFIARNFTDFVEFFIKL